MHEVLVNRLGGLSLPRKSVVRLTDRPDMTLDVYRGRKTTIQQQPWMRSGTELSQFLRIFLPTFTINISERLTYYYNKRDLTTLIQPLYSLYSLFEKYLMSPSPVETKVYSIFMQQTRVRLAMNNKRTYV